MSLASGARRHDERADDQVEEVSRSTSELCHACSYGVQLNLSCTASADSPGGVNLHTTYAVGADASKGRNSPAPWRIQLTLL